MKTNVPGQSRWMIVDDEEDSSWLMQHMLSLVTGAEVVCYNSSAEALRAFEAEPQAFDLVITDFNMPQLTGDALRERLRRLAPDLKIVLATANPDWNLDEAMHRGFDAFLPKPLSIAEVRDVATALSSQTISLQAA